MKTHSLTKVAGNPEDGTGGFAAVEGIEPALRLTKSGNPISAIKYLEASNPGMSRVLAKKIVGSFGYCSKPKWPEPDTWPGKGNSPLRCL